VIPHKTLIVNLMKKMMTVLLIFLMMMTNVSII